MSDTTDAREQPISLSGPEGYPHWPDNRILNPRTAVEPHAMNPQEPVEDPQPYRSHVLLCHDDDDDCPICRFLSGSRTTADLMRVIRVLDAELANEKKFSRDLTVAWANSVKREEEKPKASVCTCHERDSSYVCPHCYALGHRGHMEQ